MNILNDLLDPQGYCLAPSTYHSIIITLHKFFTLNLSFVASSYKNIVEDSRKYLEER